MSRSRSRKSLLEQYAEPFADLPPLAGAIAAGLLAVIGWAAPLFAGASVIAGIWLQFGRWLVWLLGGLVLAYTIVGIWRRLIDRRIFGATSDPAAMTWSQFERSWRSSIGERAQLCRLAAARWQTAASI